MNELFKSDSRLPKFIKCIIYFLKKILCILTIKENICILPYKKIENDVIINIITKILLKTTKGVVLSNYLNKCDKLNVQLYQKGIHIYKGNLLKRYLLYNFINYICKIKNEETHTKEIFILINSPHEIDEGNILYFAEHFKRINIVTKNINRFTRIERYLEEERGIGITITNNKRKSLLKANIVVNLDFDEETLNSFNINPNSIFIQTVNNCNIKSKLFNGVNVLDYQITYDNEINNFNKIEFKKFDKKLLYESTIIGKNYNTIIHQIEDDKVRIVNLIGKNGKIDIQEFCRSSDYTIN